jgi:hypothetical protein
MLLGWLYPYRTADTGMTTGATGAASSPTSAETQKTDTEGKDAATEHMIPKTRFDEVNGELQKLRAAQQKQEQAAKAEADKQAAARGEFEKLATERGAQLEKIEAEKIAAAARLTAYEAEMERQIAARLKALPDEIKAMAPDGDALTRYAWLEKAESAARKLVTTRTPGTPSGPRGSGAQQLANGTNEADLIAKKRAQVGGI